MENNDNSYKITNYNRIEFLSIENFAELLIKYEEERGQEYFSSNYVCSDGVRFSINSNENAYEKAIQHEVEWLNSESEDTSCK